MIGSFRGALQDCGKVWRGFGWRVVDILQSLISSSHIFLFHLNQTTNSCKHYNRESISILGNKDFLLPNWKEYIESSKSVFPLETSFKMVSVEGVSSQFPCFAIYVPPWFWIFGTLAVDVLLWASCINRCIRYIFLAESNASPYHFTVVPIITA